MGILRSETMKHGTLILPAEKARYFVELIGRKVQVQIEDMNQISLKRNYRKYIQRYADSLHILSTRIRIEEIERCIRFVLEEISKSGVKIAAKVRLSCSLCHDMRRSLVTK